MKKALFFLSLIISGSALACLNYYVVGTDAKGNRIETQENDRRIAGLYIEEIDIKKIRERSIRDLQDYKSTKNLDDYLNYATSLVYLGEYDKAIYIFKEIEKNAAGKYEVASNLGTAYELKGDNKNALIWIKKALQLNKDSHYGSEWIHVKILENKLGNIPLENLLGFDFGKEENPASQYSKQKLEQLSHDLAYQLSERTQFVKPTDKIVGKLYFEFGNVLALTKDLETSIKAYELSEHYGYKSKLFTKRFSHFKELIKENSESGKILSSQSKTDFTTILYQYRIVILILAGLIFISLIIIIKKRKK